jgi:hypothetical protein
MTVSKRYLRLISRRLHLVNTSCRQEACLRTDRDAAGRIAPGKGGKLSGPERRPHLGGHKGILLIGPVANHAAYKGMHSPWSSPQAVEGGPGRGHSQAGEARLFQCSRLPGDFLLGPYQHAGRTHRDSPDRRPPTAAVSGGICGAGRQCDHHQLRWAFEVLRPNLIGWSICPHRCNRKPMMPSVQPLPEDWKPLRSDFSPTSVLPSTQTPKQRSEGWVRTSLALARGTRLRLESTLQPSAGEGWGLRSNSAGILSTRVYRRTRRQTNGRSWQRTSQTLTAWNISDLGGTPTSQGKGGNPPDHWHT